MHATWYEKVISGEKKGIKAAFALTVFSMLSMVYLVLHSLRGLFYVLHLRRVRSLPRKVISVGNITVGGTGKTPFIEMLARLFQNKGLKPAILSRGYGSAEGSFSDEYLVLQENLPDVPHYTGPNRYLSGVKALEKENPDVFLLDDGFQHWQLKRDLDIVLIDALNPFGYGRLTPRGMLREPLGALKRADIFVITRSEQVDERILAVLKESLRRFNATAAIAVSSHEIVSLRNIGNRKSHKLDFIKGEKILGFCGIGNPRAFHGILKHLGADVVSFHPFRDHFKYGGEIIQLMADEAKLLECKALVTTQKDGVKLRDMKTALPLLEVQIELVVSEGMAEIEKRTTGLLADRFSEREEVETAAKEENK